MFIYSVKFVCGVQNVPVPSLPQCTPVRPGAYATEINIHNFQTQTEAAVTKRVLLLVSNDSAEGREPKFVKARPFETITLPPDSATMDDCCNLGAKFDFQAGHLNIGFLELASKVPLNVTAVYTATDLKTSTISIAVQTIAERQV